MAHRGQQVPVLKTASWELRGSTRIAPAGIPRDPAGNARDQDVYLIRGSVAIGSVAALALDPLQTTGGARVDSLNSLPHWVSAQLPLSYPSLTRSPSGSHPLGGSLARLDVLLEILGPEWQTALGAHLSSKTSLRFLAAGYADPHTVRRLGRAPARPVPLPPFPGCFGEALPSRSWPPRAQPTNGSR